MEHGGSGADPLRPRAVVHGGCGDDTSLIRFPGEFGQRICMENIIKEIGLSSTGEIFMV